jgi:ribonuclease HI
METALRIFTDGGCSGNPGPGGWAFVMVLRTFQGEQVVNEGRGAERNTTNNRMELLAVISALKALKAAGDLPRQVEVCTDSQYVQKGMTNWMYKWKGNAWRTSDKTPVKNQDLWKELDALASELTINWKWIKGHAGNEWNERCDRMTQEAIASIP